MFLLADKISLQKSPASVKSNLSRRGSRADDFHDDPVSSTELQYDHGETSAMFKAIKKQLGYQDDTRSNDAHSINIDQDHEIGYQQGTNHERTVSRVFGLTDCLLNLHAHTLGIFAIYWAFALAQRGH